MSNVFNIDGASVTDPVSFVYTEKYSPFTDAYNHIVTSLYEEATATFPILAPASYTAWLNADDGAAHSIKCFAPNSNTLTTYSNVFIEYLGAAISFSSSGAAALNFHGVSFRVHHINAVLLAFGSY